MWKSGVFLLFFFISIGIFGQNFPENFYPIEIGRNLNPTSLVLGTDGELFVTEKDGKVLLFQNDQLVDLPFIVIEVDDSHERGLMSMALHPEFERNGYFYLYYTVKGGNHNRISRFTSDNGIVSKDTESIILDLNTLAGQMHNGGAMQFGTDGKLYISTGDGVYDPNSQDLNSLLGKILRINDDGSIPEDNPYFNELGGKYRSIYALGLRNPFSFDIDKTTGEMLINDVGGSAFEEINVLRKGMNYGWPIVEGQAISQLTPTNYKDPIFSYDHDQGCAIVGAAFSPAQSDVLPPQFLGKFFFGDYCNETIKFIDPESPGQVSLFAEQIFRPIAINFNSEGIMYILERSGEKGGSELANRFSKEGVLWKVIYNESGEPVISRQPRDQLLSVGEDASFTVSVLGNEPLHYQWSQNDIELPGENNAVFDLKSVSLNENGDYFHCKISNSIGEIISEKAYITVTSTERPDPIINQPDGSSKYVAGQIISFSGDILNEIYKDLPDSAYTWWIDFHHNDHSHPALSFYQGKSGTLDIPKRGETSDNVWYRIHLNVKSPSGLANTTSTEIFPEKSRISLKTYPEDLLINLDGKYRNAPIEFQGVVGILRDINIVDNQLIDSTYYVFKDWHNGQVDRHIVLETPESDTTIIANFDKYKFSEINGLLGKYFTNQFDSYEGDPTLVKIDTSIYFDWYTESPASGIISVNEFSARWSGMIKFPETGSYVFSLIADDVGRLYINDSLVSEYAGGKGQSIAIEKVKNDSSLFLLEYSDRSHNASCKLQWKINGRGLENIKSQYLIPGDRNYFYGEKEIEGLFTIFPNPTSESINIVLSRSLSSNFTIKLISDDGQVVISKEMEGSPESLNQIKISIRNLQAGIYIISILSPSGQQSMKFIKF